MKKNEKKKLNGTKADVMLSLPLLVTDYIPSFENMPFHWMAYLENIKGMVVTCDTEEEAIDELMISIKVALLHKRGNGA